MDHSQNSEAGPSTLPRLSQKKDKKPRASRGGKVSAEGTIPSHPSASSAVPSDPVEETRKARKDAKRARKLQAQARARDEEWECVPIARSAVSKVPPVWSSDGRFYFSVSQNLVHVHSATPPGYDLLSTIGRGPDGHTRNITSLQRHPTNPMQILTASNDGTVKVWDWVEGRLVRTLVLSATGKCLLMAVGRVAGKWHVFVTAGVPKENHDPKKPGAGYYLHLRVFRILLNPTSEADKQVQTVGKLSSNPSALLVSPNSTYLVALAGTKAYTYRLPATITNYAWKPQCVKFVSDQEFTCGAFAPERVIAGRADEEWFATGDVKGVIRLWHGLTAAFRQVDAALKPQQGGSGPQRGFTETEKRLPTTSLHWHAHAVAAIAFTPSGAQLLSVGEESVLVQWHLASGKKEFVPRLGGRPLISLAVKDGSRGVEEEYWMRSSDGGVIRVGAASGQVTTIGQAARLDPLRPKDDSVPYPLAIHPPTRSLVLPSSHASTLQFVDSHSSSVLFDLEVSPSNRVSRRDEKELEPVSVEHVAFNDATDGPNRWMATVEGRKGDDVEGGGLVKNLKIWRWQSDKYVVSTQFPKPHGTADITKVAFSPAPASEGSSTTAAQPYLLTASADGTAKLWQVRQVKKTDQGKSTKKAPTFELYWSTRSTFAYRSLPIYDAVFSPDSTILALAHGSVITLWDVEKNVLLRALDGALKDVRQIGFVGEEGRFLVAAEATKGLAVWDLLSCEVVWSSAASACNSLIAEPRSPFFIAVHDAPKDHKSAYSVYRPNSAQPVRTNKASHKVNHITLLPSAAAPSASLLQFVGISHGGEIFRFGDQIAKDVHVGTNAITHNDKQVSIWQEMFGKDAFLETADPEADDAARTAEVAAAARKTGNPVDVFEGPSHTLPPVSLLFDSFLDTILLPRGKQVEAIKEDTIMYDDRADDDEADLADLPGRQKLREVKDQDIAELEGFFRDMLTTGGDALTKSQKGKLPNGTPNGRKAGSNGAKVVNVDDDEEMGEPTPKGKAGKKNKAAESPKTPAKQLIDEEDDGEVLASTESKGKKRGKKRKAPKEQQ